MQYTPFTNSPPLYTKLPFHYHKIPGKLRVVLGSLINQNKHWPTVRKDYIHKFLPSNLPKGKKYAVCFTHDVDSNKGQLNLGKFITLEKKYDIQSTIFIPGFSYRIDFDLVSGLEEEGFEIGIHGYNHSGKLPFESPKRIERKIRKVYKFFSRFVNIHGFRSPSFLLTPKLLYILRKYFTYDSSFFGVGCHPLRYNGMLEVPVFIPDDSFLIMKRYKPLKILTVWEEHLHKIKKQKGVAVILTHPDPHFSGNTPMLKIYQQLLEKISADQTCWITTCKEFAKSITTS